MHVKVPWFHISFHQKFVLVGIFSRDDQVTFWGDEPSELFEPKNFSLRKVFTENFVFFFLYFLQGFFFCQFQNLLTGLFGPLLFLVVFLLTFVVHCGISVCVVVNVDLDWQKFKNLLLTNRVSQKNRNLSLENCKLVNHISQRIAVLFAFTYHSGNIIPRVPVILHGFDDLDYSVYICNIFLNIFSFQLINILFLLKFPNSFVLIFFNLIVLFPCNAFNVLFFFVLIFFVIPEIQRYGLIKCR